MNMRLYGVPEDEDQLTDMTAYMKNLLVEVLGLKAEWEIGVEKAHCDQTLKRERRTDSPCSVVVSFSTKREKKEVLKRKLT